MLFLDFCRTVNKHLHFSHIDFTLIVKGGELNSSMLYVKVLFWYIARNWNYGILATPARTIVKAHLKLLNSGMLGGQLH